MISSNPHSRRRRGRFPLSGLLGRCDWLLLAAMGCLLAFSLLYIRCVGLKNPHVQSYWIRQAVFAGIGLGVFVAASLVDYRRWWRQLAGGFYAVSVMLLVLVLWFGTTINSAKSWLALPGGLPAIQPAELAKPAVILFLSMLGSNSRLSGWKGHALVLAAGALPIGLILLQPDWGTVLVFLPTVAVILFLRGISWKAVGVVVLMGIAAAPLLYESMPEYRKDRIKTFLNLSEEVERTEANSKAMYTVEQSRLAIGSGGVWGKGYTNGTLHILGHLPRPVAPSDLVYSVIGEEAGFAGAVTVMLALSVLIARSLWIAWKAPDEFGFLLSAAVGVVLFIHTYVNIGMNIGAAPVVGIPLPLVSYGGSAVVGFMACLGLVHSVHLRRRPSSPPR